MPAPNTMTTSQVHASQFPFSCARMIERKNQKAHSRRKILDRQLGVAAASRANHSRRPLEPAGGGTALSAVGSSDMSPNSIVTTRRISFTDEQNRARADHGDEPRFFLPVRVLSKLFRRLMLEKLLAAHAAGNL